MPLDAKLGFEYNWGSEYWFNFTGAEDAIAGSKLAARGSVYETYYIQPIISNNFFLKLGMKYYDYEYTGSGNPLGAPVKISDKNVYKACAERGEVQSKTPIVSPSDKTMAQWERIFEKKDFDLFKCSNEWKNLSGEDINDIYSYLYNYAADSPTPAKCK